MPRPNRRERELLAEQVRRDQARRRDERRAWLQSHLATTTWPRQPLRLPVGVGAAGVAAAEALRSSGAAGNLPDAA